MEDWNPSPATRLRVLFPLAVAAQIYALFVALQLWGWFVVPVFDLPMLTLLQVWGLTLLVGVLRLPARVYAEVRDIREDVPAINRLIAAGAILLAASISWAAGYFVHLLAF